MAEPQTAELCSATEPLTAVTLRAVLFRGPSILAYYNITILSYYNIIILQYYNITILSHYNIIILQYYNIMTVDAGFALALRLYIIISYYNIIILQYSDATELQTAVTLRAVTITVDTAFASSLR